MPEPLLTQISTFTILLLGGVVIGFLFDLLTAFRRVFRPRGVISFFMDFAYSAVVFAVVFPLLILTTQGELRFFVWLGLGGGVAYYHLFLHGPGRHLARLLTLPWMGRPTRFTKIKPSRLQPHPLPSLSAAARKDGPKPRVGSLPGG